MNVLNSWLLGVTLASMLGFAACQKENKSNSSARSSSHIKETPEVTPNIIKEQEQDPVHDASSLAAHEEHLHFGSDMLEPSLSYYQLLQSYLASQVAKVENNGDDQNTNNEDTSSDQGSHAATLWINFDGGDIDFGVEPGKSFILCKDKVTLSAAEQLNAEQRLEVVERVRDYYEKAGVNLYVTSEQPEKYPYSTIHVINGTRESLGCEKDDTVLGLAPYDYRNINESDTGFAFIKLVDPDKYDLVYMTSVIVAHEAGHLFGLNHIDTQHAVMYPSIQKETEGFLKGIATGKILSIEFKYQQDSPHVLKRNLGIEDGSTNQSQSLVDRSCEKLNRLKTVLELNFLSFDGFKLPKVCQTSP